MAHLLRAPSLTLVAASALAACSNAASDDPFAGTAGVDATENATTPQPTSGTATTGNATTGADGTGATKLDVGGGPDLGGGGGFAVTCDDVEKLPTNQGCEFWAVDLPNVSVIEPPALFTPPADQQFAVVVNNPSATTTANVEIFVGDEAEPIESGPVPLDTIRVFELPAMSIAPGLTNAEGVAYRIESDLPIVAYQFQPLDNETPVYSNDATILFPTHVLDGDYIAITGDAHLVDQDVFSASDRNTGAFVSIVATQDATTVTLYPTVEVHPGAVEDVMLDRGQVLTTISSERRGERWGNLSGTRVVADAPVAVFSGSVASSEPTPTEACCADHLEHQMLPVTAWGTAYLVTPAPAVTGGGSDETLVRITAGFDGTQLEYDPVTPEGAPTELDAYQSVAFVTDTAFSVRTTDDSKSIAVAQFLLSNQHFGELLRPGDPSMLLVPAAAQLQSRYAFLVPQGYSSNYVTVVRPQGVPVDVDGAAIAAVFTPLGMLDGVAYEYGHATVSAGGHVIESEEPFSIAIVGYAQDVSYGYVGGSGVAVISTPPPPPAG